MNHIITPAFIHVYNISVATNDTRTHIVTITTQFTLDEEEKKEKEEEEEEKVEGHWTSAFRETTQVLQVVVTESVTPLTHDGLS